jgi:glutathione S-transferase
MQLFIGNKNYSSWSMRPWVLMTQLGLPFEEKMLRLDLAAGSAFRAAVATISPAGRVPVLVDNGFSVWDTLAITEYLHEQFPTTGVWPADRLARARARSLASEMHSGFGALRSHCPMNIEADLTEAGATLYAQHAPLRADVARIEQLFADALASKPAASGGPFLFGSFSAADAFFAPVCTRLKSYALPMSSTTAAYVQRVYAAPGVAAWVQGALAEQDFLDFDEPYRKAR